MMISIDEFTEIMDDIAHELPDEFYCDLNGGILILPDITWNRLPEKKCSRKRMHSRSEII